MAHLRLRGSTQGVAGRVLALENDSLGFGIPWTGDPRSSAGGNSGITANRCWYYRVTGGGSISKIGMQVTTQNGNISVAVYRGSGTGRDAVPGVRLATSGSVACPGTGYQEVSLGATITVKEGDWFAISADGTAALGTIAAGIGSNISKGLGGYQETAHPAPTGPVIGTWNSRCFVLIGVP